MKAYKILNKWEYHNGLPYKTGLNVDCLGFNPSGCCESGGIYFSREDIFAFLWYGPYIREVILPEDAKVYENSRHPKKWKADKVILGKKRKIGLKVIKELIAEGANIGAGDNTVLMWASLHGYLGIIKYLVSIGADITIGDNEAIVLASFEGHLGIVKYLVSVGADISVRDNQAIIQAGLKGHSKLVKYLKGLG